MKNDGSGDAGILSSPLTFLRDGTYRWQDGVLYNRNGEGTYWSLRSANTTDSYYLLFIGVSLYPQYYNRRGLGFAVRCVSNPMVWWSSSRFYMSKRLAITYF